MVLHAPSAKVLERVRGLLAKAESTDFADEAEALVAKAQELMTRHAIDEAWLARAGSARGAPGSREVPIPDPYADAKVRLIAHIARANRARVVWQPAVGRVRVFGFDADLDAVDVLFTSLLVQATRAVAAHGSVRDAWGRSRTRSFRRSFLHGFAQRIGERLEAAAQAQVDAATEAAAADGQALLPVLAARDEEVAAAVAAAFPRLERMRSSISNGTGWRAGQAAGAAAVLGGPQVGSTGAAHAVGGRSAEAAGPREGQS